MYPEVYRIHDLPQFLEATTLFQGPRGEISSDTTITVETSTPSTIYVYVDPTKDGGLSSTLLEQGWTLAKANLTFVEEEVGEIKVLDHIWTFSVTAQQVISFTTSTNELTLVIFVKKGNFSLKLLTI